MPMRFALLGFFLAMSPLWGAETSSADLAIQARRILETHCLQCHKESGKSLAILDHAQLTRSDRPIPLVVSKKTDHSQLLEYVEEGSMPPGALPKLKANEIQVLRHWIDQGATAYPVRFDDDFALKTILKDVEKFSAPGHEEAPNFRYLTLHHLADRSNLPKIRSDFQKDLAAILLDKAPITPLDSTQTIFRIDLTKSGWHHKAFSKVDDEGNLAGVVDANLFDLALLEYPYGYFPTPSELTDKIAAKFLQPARQVRPIPFVRGDWFIDVTTSGNMSEDLASLIRLHHPLPPGFVKRRNQSHVLAHFDSGPTTIPIPQNDAWHGTDPIIAFEAIKGLTIRTMDFSLNKERSIFHPGEKFRLRFEAEETFYYEVIWINSEGGIDERFSATGKEDKGLAIRYAPGKHFDLVLPGNEGVLAPVASPVAEKLIVFVSRTPFTAADAWRASLDSRKIDRFYHPHFQLKKRNNHLAPDPLDSRIHRSTISLYISPKDKK